MLLFWIFAIPYDIPGQRNKLLNPLLALQQRFAAGEIGLDEYRDSKKVIDMDLIKKA